jgi:hypothetical protein
LRRRRSLHGALYSERPPGYYRFKHALIQDAAYDSLLKSRRQALHRRAAEILVGQPERAAAAPEVIAHHFTEAGLNDQAIEWWGKAGDQALLHSAFQEAIAHLTGTDDSRENIPSRNTPTLWNIKRGSSPGSMSSPSNAARSDSGTWCAAPKRVAVRRA